MVKGQHGSPGRVAQLLRELSRCAEAAGLTPGRGTYREQPRNAQISRIINCCFSLKLINKNLKNEEYEKSQAPALMEEENVIEVVWLKMNYSQKNYDDDL